MLHDQEAVMVLLQDGHELGGCEGAAHLQLRDVAVQAAEDAGVVAADVEDLVALQALMAVEGAGQQLWGSDEDVEGLGEQGDGGMEFDFHDERIGGFGDMRARQGGGANVIGGLLSRSIYEIP